MYHTKGYKVLCLEVKTIFGEKKPHKTLILYRNTPKQCLTEYLILGMHCGVHVHLSGKKNGQNKRDDSRPSQVDT